jgi:hypothetical protein
VGREPAGKKWERASIQNLEGNFGERLISMYLLCSLVLHAWTPTYFQF